MAESYSNQIDESPEDPSKYNQWAWLVSNTEETSRSGEALSLHSLELSPNEPSYLDTLGRCYFLSAGDVENAIKSQQKAVEPAAVPDHASATRGIRESEEVTMALRQFNVEGIRPRLRRRRRRGRRLCCFMGFRSTTRCGTPRLPNSSRISA